MPRMMNLSIIDSDPILLDCRPTYVVRSWLCHTQQMKSMVVFGQYCYACFVLMYIVTAFSYLIKIDWILCLISIACWLKRHEIYVYCYSCNIYFVFNDINYSYVVENLIWYGDYHVWLWLYWLWSHRILYDLIHCLISFDTKQACQSLTMFYGN